MPNKLLNIFSDKMFDMGGNIQFKDHESYEKFLKALQIVQDEGKAVEIDGVSSISTLAKNGEIQYPFSELKDLTKFMVYPTIEEVPIVIETKCGTKTLRFKRYYTTKEVVLEAAETEIIYIKIVFIKNTPNLTFTYRMQPHLAETIQDVVEGFSNAIALLDKLFVHEPDDGTNDDNLKTSDMRKTFSESERLFTRLLSIEKELSISFNPANLDTNSDIEEDINEIYLLLVEKKIIRLNAKLTSTEATGITMYAGATHPEIGSEIDLTFLGESECTILGHKFSVHTANLLSNAMIKKIEENEDGSVRMMYDDSDSKPMYISYTGFKTIEEAKQEMRVIIEHKENYSNALTIEEHVKASEDC